MRQVIEIHFRGTGAGWWRGESGVPPKLETEVAAYTSGVHLEMQSLRRGDAAKQHGGGDKSAGWGRSAPGPRVGGKKIGGSGLFIHETKTPSF